MRSDFFPKRLGLIAWLRESMSRRNPSSRSASSPNVEEKTLLFFSSCWTPGKGLYISSRHFQPISLAKGLHQVLKPKEKKKAFVRPPTSLNAASNITHSAIASQDSSRVTTTFNAHYTEHCVVEDFYVNFATQSRYESVPYCVHDITCKSGTSRIGLRLGPGVQCTGK